MFKKILNSRGVDPLLLWGVENEHLLFIRDNFDTKIFYRGNKIILEGKHKEVERAEYILLKMIEIARSGRYISSALVRQLVNKDKTQESINGNELDQENNSNVLNSDENEGAVIITPKKKIFPKNIHQLNYLKTVKEHALTFAVGPAGTGKTYLAVALSVEALEKGRVNRIVLTRPAVEAGESLGFLPGDMKEKVDPYLRPLYDALGDMLPQERLHRMINYEVIEVAPLAFMRGRTLSNAFVILDEAQNTTKTQMKMFLTRLGWNSRIIVTGDVTQIDLSNYNKSGLLEAIKILKDIKGISFVEFDKEDVVRPSLVSEIIHAYENR